MGIAARIARLACNEIEMLILNDYNLPCELAIE